MSALVRKEIRLVLPAWLAAMVLAIVPVWLVWPGPYAFILESQGVAVYAPFAVGVLLLGLTPFGQELNFGTFSMLLAQPVSRRHLWLVKTTVLATALGLVFAALFFSNHIRVESVLKAAQTSQWQKVFERPATAAQILKLMAETRRNVLHDSLLLGGLCVLVAFASGLWTNLFFRNTSAAFWFSLLVPLGLGLLAGKLFGGLPQGMADAGLIATLGIYSAAGFVWAKKMFLCVQDTQWTGGILSFPAMLKGRAGSPARNHKPFRALIRKEFQLQQVNLLIAGLLLVSHGIVILVRRVSADYFMSHRSAAMIWESWPLLWLAMPLLVGGLAVAEERKLGMLENFLCLPATRRREFAMKFLVTMVLGILLGGVVPLAVESLGTLIGLPTRLFDTTISFDWKLLSLVGVSLAGSAGLTVLAFYASTLTRNLLQAMGLAVVLSVATALLAALAVAAQQMVVAFWRGPLIALIGWPVMIGTLMVLSYRNFKQLSVDARIWSRNLLTIFTALVLTAVSTTVVYNRVWEIWMPEEPVHDWRQQTIVLNESRHSRGKNGFALPRMEASRSCTAVILPGGRLWLRERPVKVSKMDFGGRVIDISQPAGSWWDGFVAGTSWRAVAVSERACVAIQVDGSMWDLSEVHPGKGGVVPKRFGGSNGWEAISTDGEHFTALKSDGTLWEWGYKTVSTGRNFSRQNVPAPLQVGTDSDWTAICESHGATAAMKRDGSVWRFGRIYGLNSNGKGTATRFAAQPERWLSFPGHHPVSLSVNMGGSTLAAVCDDGTLWIGGDLLGLYGLLSPETAVQARHEMVRLESDSDWKEACFFAGNALVAVTQGGELWEWVQRFSPSRGEILVAQMPSRYSDWLCASSDDDDGFFALARDGKICRWSDRRSALAYDHFYGYGSGSLLGPSRIKAKTIAEIRR